MYRRSLMAISLAPTFTKNLKKPTRSTRPIAAKGNRAQTKLGIPICLFSILCQFQSLAKVFEDALPSLDCSVLWQEQHAPATVKAAVPNNGSLEPVQRETQ